MMKKCLALLCAALLVLSAAAYADSTATIDFMDRFEITGSLPDGWRCTILSQTDMTLEGDILSEAGDSAAPVMKVFISFNESYAGINGLKDLDENQMALIRKSFSDDYTVSFEEITTDSDAVLLAVRETGDDQDYLDFYTIYQGYEIELTLTAGDGVPGRTLTDEQIQKCTAFAKTLSFGPIQ